MVFTKFNPHENAQTNKYTHNFTGNIYGINSYGILYGNKMTK